MKLVQYKTADTAVSKRSFLLTSSELFGLCRRCGDIESIRVLHERFCAFVNFKSADMAAHAMEKLNVRNTFLTGFLSFLVKPWCNIKMFLAH